MTASLAPLAPFDPKLDLVLERTADVPVELVWKGWTEPEQLKQWWTPAPWKTIAAEIDLRAGGIFANTMQSPEGQEFPNEGCYLEVVPNRRLVWTGALKAGYRPTSASVLGSILFTAVVQFEPTANGGTKYTARVMHQNEEHAKKHEEMGFIEGWSAVWEQLVALIQKQQGK
jgi:uncharacterized protein YndB with AHSA1/START domain